MEIPNSLIERLLQVKGVGNVFTNKLLLGFQGSQYEDLESYVMSKLSQERKHQLETISAVPTFDKYNIISILDDAYPQDLITFCGLNTPPLLYLKGNKDLLEKKKIAFSGSRNVSPKGINITRECVESVSSAQIVIVSGYANGVDNIAHLTSLSSGGNTIIVLPNGMDHFVLKSEYLDNWDWNRVLVISEFSPKASWTIGRAMQRNNTIIGLSDAVVVIEAGLTGGSIDAGRKTLKGGKKLFVPFYNPSIESALGNDTLINEGAIPIRKDRNTLKPNLNPIFESLQSRPSA